jgi:hypothetical protein
MCDNHPYPRLLCATMLVIADTPCSRVSGAHIRTRGRDQPVIRGAQIVQRTELQIVKDWPGVVNAAYLCLQHIPQSAICRHNYHYRKRLRRSVASGAGLLFPDNRNATLYRKYIDCYRCYFRSHTGALTTPICRSQLYEKAFPFLQASQKGSFCRQE